MLLLLIAVEWLSTGLVRKARGVGRRVCWVGVSVEVVLVVPVVCLLQWLGVVGLGLGMLERGNVLCRTLQVCQQCVCGQDKNLVSLSSDLCLNYFITWCINVESYNIEYSLYMFCLFNGTVNTSFRCRGCVQTDVLSGNQKTNFTTLVRL